MLISNSTLKNNCATEKKQNMTKKMMICLQILHWSHMFWLIHPHSSVWKKNNLDVRPSNMFPGRKENAQFQNENFDNVCVAVDMDKYVLFMFWVLRNQNDERNMELWFRYSGCSTMHGRWSLPKTNHVNVVSIDVEARVELTDVWCEKRVP